MACKMVKSALLNIGYFLYQLDPDMRRLECLHLKNSKKKQTAVFDGLVSLLNGISTLFRLFNAKAILLEEQ